MIRYDGDGLATLSGARRLGSDIPVGYHRVPKNPNHYTLTSSTMLSDRITPSLTDISSRFSGPMLRTRIDSGEVDVSFVAKEALLDTEAVCLPLMSGNTVFA